MEGAAEIKRIVTGVSLSQDLVQEALKKGADMIMVHHGIFGRQVGDPPVLEGFLKERVKILLENNINLAGFHLPLDAHPEIGNNASLCRKLGLTDLESFDIGFIGKPEKGINFKDLVNMVNEKLATESYAIGAGPGEVKRVGVVSGGASERFLEARKKGADTFITGEVKEFVVRAVEESGVNFISAGHYNTEKDGIYNLGELVKKEFGVEHEFIDIPCDI